MQTVWDHAPAALEFTSWPCHLPERGSWPGQVPTHQAATLSAAPPPLLCLSVSCSSNTVVLIAAPSPPSTTTPHHTALQNLHFWKLRHANAMTHLFSPCSMPRVRSLLLGCRYRRVHVPLHSPVEKLSRIAPFHAAIHGQDARTLALV